MRRHLTSSTVLFFLLFVRFQANAQSPLPLTPRDPNPTDQSNHPRLISPLTRPTLSPGVIMLMELEGRFAQDVAKRGGKAFSSWFAEDAVTLSNGKPAVLGLRAIAADAVWDPKDYQLTWTPQGAQMGPSGDTGFTWGHYESHSLDKNGKAVTVSGRYITFWKKVADGSWKVALDAGANDAPTVAVCCTVPGP
ncbi:MAG: nuclear transport factor 2 family protein [Acidobacteriota bacterium]|nr:nuclear transport factor 2 family protein [Acidobacteriota bacterium]